MDKKIKLSVIIPVYNSAMIFPELYKRLAGSLARFGDEMEIIAVADGCRDDSAKVISAYCAIDKRLKMIEFSRNFGHQAAISAGLSRACGEMVIVMDDDLEDPPEILPKLISKLEEGFDVVYGVRKKRKRSIIHRITYGMFYRLLNKLVSFDIPVDAGDFCIMRKQVVDAMNNMPERNMYLRGLRSWAGFKQTGIEYERGERFASRSGYSLKKYVLLALDAIFSFSYTPLRLVSVTGLVIALFSFLYGISLITLKLLNRVQGVAGWTSILVSFLFLSGIQLFAAGIIGEYIARIYDEVKQRPKFIIGRSINLEEK